MDEFVKLQENADYEINRRGEVRNRNTRRALKPILRADGYIHITLYNKVYLLHRLIGGAFIPNTEDMKCVIHLDGNKVNNDIANLQWSDQKTACNNSQKYRKTTRKPVYQMSLTGEAIKEYGSSADAAKVVGCSVGNIRVACNKGIAAMGFKWKYTTPARSIASDTTEIWKEIVIGEDVTDYSVSNTGKVKNRRSGRLITGSIHNGYHRVSIRISGKSVCRSTHRLVATYFREKKHVTDEVDHIDGNKSNNFSENLRWVSRRMNVIAALGKKVLKIDIVSKEVVQTFDSITLARDDFDASGGAFYYKLDDGKSTDVGGFTWEKL